MSTRRSISPVPGSLRRGAYSFGIVASRADARDRLKVVCDGLGRAAGLIFYPQVLPSYGLLKRQIASGSIDVAWAPPLVALDLERSGGARVVASTKRERGTVYHAAIFVRRGLGARTFADLRGRHMAWVAEESMSGYVLPRLWIASGGVDPKAFFGRETFYQTHDRVVAAVLGGRADAGATHAAFDPETGVLLDAGWIEKLRATPDAVDVLATAGPIPTDTVVVAQRVSNDSAARITEALLGAGASMVSAIRNMFGAEGFVRADSSHLASIARYPRGVA